MRPVLRSITKIFQPQQWFKEIPQTFLDSPYRTQELALAWWFGCFLRVRSAEQLEDWLRMGVLARVTRARNRAWDRVAGWRIAAIDGVELFRSRSAVCPDCRHRLTDGASQWRHQVVVASVVGARRPLALDWETIRNADGGTKAPGEQGAAYRLMDRLVHIYHHQIDGVVADALSCTQVFLERVRQNGWWAVVRLKDDRLTIWQDAAGLLAQQDPVVCEDRDGVHRRIWEVADLTWGACTGLRVIHGERIDVRRHRVAQQMLPDTVTRQGWALTTADAAAVPAHTVYQIMRARWALENCVFRTEKTEWELTHCFGHHPAIIEAVVGMQLAGLSLWKWWHSQGTRSARDQALPFVRVIEHAWLELTRLRMTVHWLIPPTT